MLPNEAGITSDLYEEVHYVIPDGPFDDWDR
jgi:hypothetical protein